MRRLMINLCEKGLLEEVQKIFFEIGFPQPPHQNDAYGRFITLF
jgi:hypothetical protein